MRHCVFAEILRINRLESRTGWPWTKKNVIVDICINLYLCVHVCVRACVRMYLSSFFEQMAWTKTDRSPLNFTTNDLIMREFFFSVTHHIPSPVILSRLASRTKSYESVTQSKSAFLFFFIVIMHIIYYPYFILWIFMVDIKMGAFCLILLLDRHVKLFIFH